MKKKFGNRCGEETLHITAHPEKREDRCTRCSWPPRTGNLNPKNIVERRWNGIHFGGRLDEASAKAFGAVPWASKPS